MGILIFRDWVTGVLLSICIIAAIFNLANSLATRLTYEDGIISKSSLLKKESIKLDEVEGILLLPTTKGKKVFVGVYTHFSKMIITFWFKDYKVLLRLVIEYCKKLSSVKIDPRIFDVLKA
jgi:hypothetical protein